MKDEPIHLEEEIRGYFRWLRGEGHADLERYAGGQLPTEGRSAAQAHIDACAICRQALAEYAAVADVWEAPPLPSRQARWRVLQERLSVARLALGAAAAALIVVLVVVLWPSPAPPTLSPLQAKGGFDLKVAVDRNGQAFMLRSSDRLETGDRLGFFYSAGQTGYLAIFYGDEAGHFVRLFPTQAQGGARVATGSEVRLSEGAVISPGNGCEWVVSVFSPAPLPPPEALGVVDKMYRDRVDCHLARPDRKDLSVRVVEVRR